MKLFQKLLLSPAALGLLASVAANAADINNADTIEYGSEVQASPRPTVASQFTDHSDAAHPEPLDPKKCEVNHQVDAIINNREVRRQQEQGELASCPARRPPKTGDSVFEKTFKNSIQAAPKAAIDLFTTEPQYTAADTKKNVELGQSSRSEKKRKDAGSHQNWRGYIDILGFTPLRTTGYGTLYGVEVPIDMNLQDELRILNGAFFGRITVEHDRVGLFASLNRVSAAKPASGSGSAVGKAGAGFSCDSSLNQLRKLVNRKTKDPCNPGAPGQLNTSASIGLNGYGEGSVKVSTKQLLTDIALRYRAGEIQKPIMKPNSMNFIGYAGVRVVDVSLSIDYDAKLDLNGTVQADGSFVGRRGKTSTSGFDKEAATFLQKGGTLDFGKTWTQPLIGMQVNYAVTPRWQIFSVLEAAGFGLSGAKDLSGNISLGLAYALGNSSQISLGWKYFGLEYAQNESNKFAFATYQNGLNLGFHWFFGR